MAHPYKAYHEDKVSRARVGKILSSGGTSAAHEKTKDIYPGINPGSVSAMGNPKVPGKKSPGRYARGGKVKGHRTNIAIVVPQKSPPTQGPQAGAAVPPPMAAPAPPMPPPGAGGPPPGGPPGMPPMRARGGKVAGEATKSNIKKMDKRSAKNSFYAGGVADNGNRGVADLESEPEAAQQARSAAAHRLSKGVLKRASGGRLPTAGAESGVGRLQKAR